MDTTNNPLGIPLNLRANSHVDLRAISASIETKYPKLWQMLQKHPLEGGLHVLSSSAYVKRFGIDPEKGHSSSATHDMLDDSITLNSGALPEITAADAWGTWWDGRIEHKTEKDKIYAAASFNQGTPPEDFYLLVTMHELGHHFSRWAREIDKIGTVVGLSYLLAEITNQAVSPYALSDIEEYWAESFSAYWYMPDALKKVDECAYLGVKTFTELTLKGKKASDQLASSAA